MKERANHGVAPGLLAAYLEGEVTPSEANAVSRTLETSPEAQRELDELRRVRERLAETPVDLASVDLVASVRAGMRQQQPSSSASTLRGLIGWLGLGFGATAAFAALFLWARPALLSRPERELTAKSAAGDHRSAGERWAGVRVFEEPAAPGQSLSPVERSVHRGRGLLFSYNNVGPRPYSHLMIFSRDAGGEVRWFHPAYEDAAAPPRSIAIRARETDVLLNEIVRQPFPAGQLALFALFSRQPLGVSEVEGWLVSRPADAPAGLGLPESWGDVYLQRLSLVVLP